MEFLYVIWLEDPKFPEDDQDHFWNACFIITASNGVAAQAWGDHLAKKWVPKTEYFIVSSSVEDTSDLAPQQREHLPVVADGEDASDAKIGW